MKNQEQIKLAQETIRELQDYVELARCEKKLKLNDNVETIGKQISKVVSMVKNNVEDI